MPISYYVGWAAIFILVWLSINALIVAVLLWRASRKEKRRQLNYYNHYYGLGRNIDIKK